MSQVLIAASALALLSEPPTATLQRERHDDAIYIVHGTPDQLRRFESEVGSHWEGGKLLAQDEAKGLYRYWAFADRTAPQAQTLMLRALMFGLVLDIHAYEERNSFLAERSKLDEIATSCGLIHDPFFITPAAELKVSFGSAESTNAIDCAKQKLKASQLANLKGQVN